MPTFKKLLAGAGIVLGSLAVLWFWVAVVDVFSWPFADAFWEPAQVAEHVEQGQSLPSAVTFSSRLTYYQGIECRLAVIAETVDGKRTIGLVYEVHAPPLPEYLLGKIQNGCAWVMAAEIQQYAEAHPK